MHKHKLFTEKGMKYVFVTSFVSQSASNIKIMKTIYLFHYPDI